MTTDSRKSRSFRFKKIPLSGKLFVLFLLAITVYQWFVLGITGIILQVFFSFVLFGTYYSFLGDPPREETEESMTTKVMFQTPSSRTANRDQL